jgi:hypothetical protein
MFHHQQTLRTHGIVEILKGETDRAQVEAQERRPAKISIRSSESMI